MFSFFYAVIPPRHIRHPVVGRWNRDPFATFSATNGTRGTDVSAYWLVCNGES